MTRDYVITAIIAGLVASPVSQAFTATMSSLGLSRVTCLLLAISLFGKATIAGPADLLLAWSSHIVISVIFALGLVDLLAVTGSDYLLLKGAAYGGAVWFLAIALFLPALEVPIVERLDVASDLSLLGHHLLWGMVVAWTASSVNTRLLSRR